LAQALESGGSNVGGYQRKNRPRSGAAAPCRAVLLDVMMPDMDGFRNLPAKKRQQKLEQANEGLEKRI